MRVAVIGLGRMGRRHVEVVRGLGLDVVGVCDQSQECLDIARREFDIGSDRCFQDATDMLDKVRAEAVIVATTAPSHATLVCAAVRLGSRYILCEKPAATSVAQVEQMLEVCQANGVELAVNHQMRFMPQYTEVRALVGTPQLGGLVSIAVAGSNFGLAMNASHYFEMFRYMSGGEAQAVQAWLDDERVPNPRGPQFQDRGGKVRVTGSDGVSMWIDCSVAAGHGLSVIYICRFGQIFVDELSGFMRISRRQDQYRELPTTRYGMPAVEKIQQISPADVIAPTRALWEAMFARQSYPDGRAGLHAVKCLAAAHASHDLGGVCIDLNDARIDRQRVFPWA